MVQSVRYVMANVRHDWTPVSRLRAHPGLTWDQSVSWADTGSQPVLGRRELQEGSLCVVASGMVGK